MRDLVKRLGLGGKSTVRALWLRMDANAFAGILESGDRLPDLNSEQARQELAEIVRALAARTAADFVQGPSRRRRGAPTRIDQKELLRILDLVDGLAAALGEDSSSEHLRREKRMLRDYACAKFAFPSKDALRRAERRARAALKRPKPGRNPT